MKTLYLGKQTQAHRPVGLFKTITKQFPHVISLQPRDEIRLQTEHSVTIVATSRFDRSDNTQTRKLLSQRVRQHFLEKDMLQLLRQRCSPGFPSLVRAQMM